MDEQQAGNLVYESRPPQRVTWRGAGQFAAGFGIYWLVAACATLVGSLGRWLSVAAVPIGVLMGVLFLAFVIDAHRKRWTAFALGAVAGLLLTVLAGIIAFGLLLWITRGPVVGP